MTCAVNQTTRISHHTLFFSSRMVCTSHFHRFLLSTQKNLNLQKSPLHNTTQMRKCIRTLRISGTTSQSAFNNVRFSLNIIYYQKPLIIISYSLLLLIPLLIIRGFPRLQFDDPGHVSLHVITADPYLTGTCA